MKTKENVWFNSQLHELGMSHLKNSIPAQCRDKAVTWHNDSVELELESFLDVRMAESGNYQFEVKVEAEVVYSFEVLRR